MDNFVQHLDLPERLPLKAICLPQNFSSEALYNKYTVGELRSTLYMFEVFHDVSLMYDKCSSGIHLLDVR